MERLSSWFSMFLNFANGDSRCWPFAPHADDDDVDEDEDASGEDLFIQGGGIYSEKQTKLDIFAKTFDFNFFSQLVYT